MKELPQSLRDKCDNLAKDLSDIDQDFYCRKYPEIWDDVYDISTESRYARAIKNIVKHAYRQCFQDMCGLSINTELLSKAPADMDLNDILYLQIGAIGLLASNDKLSAAQEEIKKRDEMLKDMERALKIIMHAHGITESATLERLERFKDGSKCMDEVAALMREARKE